MVDVDLEVKLVRATTIGNIRVVIFFGGTRLWSPCGTDAVLRAHDAAHSTAVSTSA